MKLKITDFANGGYGTGSINGKIVFVENALPNEVVEIEIVQEKKGFIRAFATDILKPSVYRVKPKCPYYLTCGGCDLQHACYDYQLKLKQSVFVSTLKRIGKIELNKMPKIVPSERQWHYRRRLNFKCKNGKWGFYKRSTNQFTQIDECKIADKGINKFINNNRCFRNMRVQVDDYGNVNIDEMVMDLGFEQPLFYKKSAFTQVNRDVNLKIIQDLLSEVHSINPASILELFCGIGNFTIPLAKNGYKIYAVELDLSAISSLKRNINNFGLKNVNVVKRNLFESFKIKDGCDLVILDPPREGAKEVAQWLLKRNIKHVIYISCDVVTLSRDLNIINSKYTIEKVKLYDMFPQTHHVESMVVLKLNKD